MQRYDESFDRYVSNSANTHSSIDEMHHRDSIHFSGETKNLSESMNFEESESVMWRKVMSSM